MLAFSRSTLTPTSSTLDLPPARLALFPWTLTPTSATLAFLFPDARSLPSLSTFSTLALPSQKLALFPSTRTLKSSTFALPHPMHALSPFHFLDSRSPSPIARLPPLDSHSHSCRLLVSLP
eukprot:3718823-Rhodomonas_salina.1